MRKMLVRDTLSRRAGADARFLASAISRRDSLLAGLWRGYTLRHHAVLQATSQPGRTAIRHHQHLSARAPFPLREITDPKEQGSAPASPPPWQVIWVVRQ